MDGSMVRLVILTLFVHIAECMNSPVTINVSAAGTFNSSCLHNLGVCANLTQVLVYSSSQFPSNLVILLQPATEPYTLSAKVVFHASSDVTISGIGEVPVRVTCTAGGAGIAFNHSQQIVIQNLSFSGCGSLYDSTSRDFSQPSEVLTFIPFYVTLYFQQCSSIIVDFVTVTNSTGVGMQIYATSGINHITNSNFTFNPSVENQELNVTRCGGLYIEFPYCLPGDTTCNDSTSAIPLSNISNSIYYITNCLFANNYAKVENISSTFILPYKSNHDVFGRGGGLSLFIKSRATNNSVIISNSNFEHNHAVFGGGMMVEFHDDAANNDIVIKNSTFSQNNASQGGGGSRMTFIAYQSKLSNNTISTAQCLFDNNSASWGGGVTFLTTKEQQVTEPSNKLYYNDTVWTRNNAQLGSAIDMTIFHPCLKGEVVNIQFFRCNFSKNSNWKSVGMPIGTGAVYFDSVHGTFYDFALFADNTDGSALVGFNSQITFFANTSIVFTDNIGRNGGAIALLGNAVLLLGNYTKFRFTRNIAYGLGGAIYSLYPGNRELINSRNCFFQYFDINTDPQDWNVEFVFEENKPDTSVIFSTTIYPCLWGRSTGPSNADHDEFTKVFCWNDHGRKWVYNNKTDSCSCVAAIQTDPASLDTQSADSLRITPGISTGMKLNATDDQGDDVTDTVVFIVRDLLSFGAQVDDSYHYISNDKIVLRPIGTNTSAFIVLETSSPRMLHAEMNITFTECYVGYNLSENGSCVPNGKYGGLVSYTPNVHEAALLRGYWIGKMNNSTLPVVAQCKYCQYNTTLGFITLNHTLHEASLQFCPQNRTGDLCAQCVNGTAPAFNTDNFDCVECDEQLYWSNWIFFVILKLVIPLLMFLLLYIANFSLTSGLLNGAILFAQMITTAVAVDAKGVIDYQMLFRSYGKAPEIIRGVYMVLYGIWNLDFCPPCFGGMCIAPNTTAVQVLASNYIVAFLPLIIVCIALFVYWLDFLCGICKSCNYNNSCGVLAKLCDIFKGSAPTALAALIILSYTKIAIITAYLLSRLHLIVPNGSSLPQKVMYFDGIIPYFGRTHLPYALVAVIVGIPFLIIVPILLICYRYDDPDNKGGFFNHILKEFQREFRDGLPREPAPHAGNDDEQFQPQLTCNPMKMEAEKDYQISLGCCKIEDKIQYWFTFNTTRILCGCKIKCCHGNCWCYTLWSRYDFRWVSGIYFVLRLALLMCFCYDLSTMVMYQIQIIICLVSAIFILIVWPYKKSIHNILDASWLLLIVAIISLSSFQFFWVSIDIEPEKWAYWLQNCFLFLPAVWITFCVFVIEPKKQKTYQKVWKVIKVLLCCKKCFKQNRYFNLMEYSDEGKEDQANDSILYNPTD